MGYQGLDEFQAGGGVQNFSSDRVSSLLTSANFRNILPACTSIMRRSSLALGSWTAQNLLIVLVGCACSCPVSLILGLSCNGSRGHQVVCADCRSGAQMTNAPPAQTEKMDLNQRHSLLARELRARLFMQPQTVDPTAAFKTRKLGSASPGQAAASMAPQASSLRGK